MKMVTVPYDCLIGYQLKELLHQWNSQFKYKSHAIGPPLPEVFNV